MNGAHLIPVHLHHICLLEQLACELLGIKTWAKIHIVEANSVRQKPQGLE
jgi:hypothetical protein